MKRCFLPILFILVFAICLLSVFASAEDSINIPAEIQLLIDEEIESSDYVIKLYGGSFMKKFASGDSISSIIDNTEPGFDKFMVITKKDIEYYKIIDDALEKLDPSTGLSDWSGYYEYAISPKKVLNSASKVNAVYCLDGEPSKDGVFIYYQTADRDYILYKAYLNSKDMYLFPADEFVSFAQEVYSYRQRHKDEDGGARSLEDIFSQEQLKPYKVIPDNNNAGIRTALIVCIISVFAVVAVGTVFFAVRAKKK